MYYNFAPYLHIPKGLEGNHAHDVPVLTIVGIPSTFIELQIIAAICRRLSSKNDGQTAL